MNSVNFIWHRFCGHILKKVENIADRFSVAIYCFTPLWEHFYDTIVLHFCIIVFMLLHQITWPFPWRVFVTSFTFFFIKTRKIEVRLSVLIFQRWSSIKGSYLKSALSTFVVVCVMCSIMYSATVAKAWNKHTNFHAVLFCNLWIKICYIYTYTYTYICIYIHIFIYISKVGKALFKITATAIRRCPFK